MSWKCQIVKRQKAVGCYRSIPTCCYVHSGIALRIRDGQCYLCLLCFCAQGFRLLLASPDAGFKLFRGLQSNGHGQAKLFEGRPLFHNVARCNTQARHIIRNTHSVKLFQKGVKGEESITVDEILKDDSFQAENNYVQVSAIVSSDSIPERKTKKLVDMNDNPAPNLTFGTMHSGSSVLQASSQTMILPSESPVVKERFITLRRHVFHCFTPQPIFGIANPVRLRSAICLFVSACFMSLCCPLLYDELFLLPHVSLQHFALTALNW